MEIEKRRKEESFTTESTEKEHRVHGGV